MRSPVGVGRCNTAGSLSEVPIIGVRGTYIGDAVDYGLNQSEHVHAGQHVFSTSTQSVSE